MKKNSTSRPALLMLADGSHYRGLALGHHGTSSGEICFNTGMTGYQEIYTDPSYFGQIIINTVSHVGNYGTHPAEQESARVRFNGLVCDRFAQVHSRESSQASLQDYLQEAGITGIYDIDTRQIVRKIRDKGAMNAIISSTILDEQELAAELEKVPSMLNLELASQVSVKEPFNIGSDQATYKVAVLDLGIKTSILTNLTSRHCVCRVFPAKTPVEDMMAWQPDAFFISNGPGDPAAMPYAIETVKELVNINKPTFGICMGHQVLALSQGINTYKMHNGHRGLNHPVKNLLTGYSEITSQNHGFAVSLEEVKKHAEAEVTHINLNDNTLEGFRLKDRPVFSVQYHPESSPGPHDSYYLFDDFVTKIKEATK